MFIAFKWLLALGVAMWIAMCFLDIYKPRNGKFGYISEISVTSFKPHRNKNRTFRYGNWDQNLDKDNQNNFRVEQESILVQYLIFAAGAIFVLIFQQKHEIILYTKGKIAIIDIVGKTKAIIQIKNHYRLNKLAGKVGVAYRQNIIFCLRILKTLWASLSYVFTHFILEKLDKKQGMHKQATENKFVANVILSTKNMKIISKKNTHPNDVIRNNIDKIPNSELTENVSSGSKDIVRKADEQFNQLRHANNFQYLYIITRHENIVLKNRLKKICQEKNQIERKFVILINEVFSSKNSKLKSLCSTFTVDTKNNLLHGNVEKELKQFLEHSGDQVSTSRNCLERSVDSDMELYNEAKQEAEKGKCPNLRHVSSDVVWTVKGKDGNIEKLYEYSLAPAHGGETVKTIREYSVYFEKARIINQSINNADFPESLSNDTDEYYTHFCKTVPSRKFLSESPVFKKFLIDNKRLPALME